MRKFRSIDYFRKVAPEHTSGSILGGIMSILCTFTIGALILGELNDFQQPKVSRMSFVHPTSMDGKSEDALQFNLTFFGLPCELLEVEAENSF